MKIVFFTQADNYPDRAGVAPVQAQAGIVRAMKDWPTAWDDTLQNLMPVATNHQIAKRLGASAGLVGFRIQKLGLTRTPEQQERLYGNIRGRLVSGMNIRNQQATGTCKWVQKRPRARPKRNGGVRPPDKPEWWIFLGKGERMPLRRYLWEKWVGPVPKGHNICFADGNPRRCVLSNLICLNNKDMTTYFRLSIQGAMQRRAFWNSPQAKESYRKASLTRIAFNKTEKGKAVMAKRSENMRQAYAEGRINNPFVNLHDRTVAYYITQDPEMMEYVLEHRQDLIELKRAELLLKRTIKQQSNHESVSQH